MKLGNHSIRIGRYKVEVNRLSLSTFYFLADRNDEAVGGTIYRVRDYNDLLFKLTTILCKG